MCIYNFKPAVQNIYKIYKTVPWVFVYSLWSEQSRAYTELAKQYFLDVCEVKYISVVQRRTRN